MLENKRQEDLQFKLYRFRARSVPSSTYKQPNNDWKTNKQRYRTRSLPSRNYSSLINNSFKNKKYQQNIHQYIHSPPLSTYLRPSSCSQSMEELRALKAQKRSIELLSKSYGPIGIEEHSIRWKILYKLRHSQQCLASSKPLNENFKAQTISDFVKLQEEFTRQLAASRRYRTKLDKKRP
ncbi:SMC_N domain-containing protein [Meloidogyne graminicola]|uniref:SMC_N domain-containing protein n=1 Tax=Meloidogyne graminicola TaxID=189291 RepID=A0A8S9Z8K6_9BILA|nr:SMC_N domain-containing protein [Meloidogyne graminicola]